ncbi:hypothetical protein KY358_04660, partial [Candidatus Woesearchaeota archaeon]|nr:hypothetical protein [Candidatus Woesearchaeota archaeon]
MTSSVLSRKTFFIAALALIPFLPILLAGVDYYHTADPLFDIQIYIPDRYTEILPGSELLASIRLVNLGGTRRVDVTLDYWIEGPDGRLILEKKETVAVETQANFVRAFDIPKSSSPGKYILYSRITYAGGLEASAEHSFDV